MNIDAIDGVGSSGFWRLVFSWLMAMRGSRESIAPPSIGALADFLRALRERA